MNAKATESWSVARPMLIGIVGLVLLVAGFGTWATLTQISGAIIAGGRIEVDQNRQVVQHPDGGVVFEIEVSEGDAVEEGDTLIRLDETELKSQLTIISSQLYELMARRGRLEAERDAHDIPQFDPLLLTAAASDAGTAELVAGQERLLKARAESELNEISQFEKRKEQVSEQITGLEAQKVSTNRQLEIIRDELQSQEKLLEQGLTQSSRVMSLQRDEAQLIGSLGQLTAQVAQAEGQITEIDMSILRTGSRRREEAISNLRDLQYRELELREKYRALTDRINRLNITAPSSGIVYGLQIFTLKSVVRPADPVMYIIPQDRPLVINAEVDPIHIDKLYVGQEVTLRFSALDQSRTPELKGQVTQISADAFENESTQLSFYRASITLSEDERDRLPDGTRLIPGMPVEAFIRTEDRTPITYLVKPFTDYLTKAFRE